MPDCGVEYPNPIEIKPIELNSDEIKQVHDYIRHLFHMFLSWFTVFATVNYATMGWLASLGPNAHFLSIAKLVAVMFVAQNLLALVCAREVWRALKRQADKVGGAAGVVPMTLYFRAIALIAIAIGLTAIAWLIAVVLWGGQPRSATRPCTHKTGGVM